MCSMVFFSIIVLSKRLVLQFIENGAFLIGYAILELFCDFFEDARTSPVPDLMS